jgi:hypothetical protein
MATGAWQSPQGTSSMGGAASVSAQTKIAQLEQLVRAQREYITALEKRLTELEKQGDGK